MKINRTCKICGKQFQAIKTTQFFCSRKCFKRDYYARTKIKLQDSKQKPNFPIKICNFCEESSRLSFDPVISAHLYNAWACPKCGATNRLIWEHMHKPNSHQIISKILISFSSSFQVMQNTIIQRQTYHLPILRPEQGNPYVVIMTCENLNIVDIQKRNRKKIVFS
jgi:endogenous inhibitor of DNA gyrase (YacG/DUF329 family)